MNNKEIKNGLLKIDELSRELQEKRNFIGLNILSDYRVILHDERVNKDLQGQNILKELLQVINEFKNENIDKIESYLSIMRKYRDFFKLDTMEVKNYE